jgi:hypothetical protein
MAGPCSISGGDKKICTEFCFESLKVRDHSEDVGTNEMTILRWKIGWTKPGWIEMTDGASGRLCEHGK